jgi:polysaccharide biosynthesis protein PslH
MSPSSPPHLLWILPKWPLPATDGARVANVNLLRGLGELGATIDVIAVAERGEVPDPEALKRIRGVASVRIVDREPTGRGFQFLGVLSYLKHFCLKPWQPVTLAPFAARKVRERLSALIAEGPPRGGGWTGVVYDGLHTAAHSSSAAGFVPPAPGLPVFYRAHNVEADIWRRKAELTGFAPLRLFLRLQAHLMERFESSVIRAAAAVLSVSEKDFERFASAVPGLKGGPVPIGYDFSEASAPSAPARELRLLFLGKLDWLPNRDGLIWFLDRVWKEAKARRPGLELWIAGSGESDWLKIRTDVPGIRFLGRVERVDDLYRDCSLSIVPVFYGSGTRVKAIESSKFSRPCLSTELGVEGLGLTADATYFRGETAEEWIAALASLEPARARAVGEAAHDFLKGTFHLPFAAGKFLERIAV